MSERGSMNLYGFAPRPVKMKRSAPKRGRFTPASPDQRRKVQAEGCRS